MPDSFPLNEIPDGGTLSVSLSTGEQVCLIRRGVQVSALHDVCTHQGMPLSAGEVLPDGTIQCAWHGARFDCVTGAVMEGPAEDDVKSYEVRVVGESVLVAERGGSDPSLPPEA
jgi:3-phenylpropionate/trans-cinnamate dioxygenase ferredoxin subunit